jgi:hypothetical protein
MKRFAQYLLPVLGMATGMVSAAAQLTPRTILVVLSKQYPDNPCTRANSHASISYTVGYIVARNR